jgi:hypothetical protein
VFNTFTQGGYVSGSPYQNATTLVHELLHATVDIFGISAVSSFWHNNDTGPNADPNAQSLNRTLIGIDCGAGFQQSLQP